MIRAVLHPTHGPGLIDALATVPGIDVVTPDDGDAVVDLLADGEPSLLITYLWDDRFLQPGVQWVQSLSAGYEQFPLDRLRTAGVVFTSAHGVHTPAVAEHAIALLLALSRRLDVVGRDVARREWRPPPAYELAGRTVGILGLGAIGEAIAVRTAALGMRVIGTKLDPGSYSGVAELVLGADGTPRICAAADDLIIALPSDPSTTASVGTDELSALGPGWLVNIGRGSVVDEHALVEALRHGELRGAGLDVFAAEPLAHDSLLWGEPGIVLTPHMAWSSDRLPARIAALVALNLEAWEGDGEWRNRLI